MDTEQIKRDPDKQLDAIRDSMPGDDIRRLIKGLDEGLESDHALKILCEKTIATTSRAKVDALKMIEKWLNNAPLFEKIKDYINFLVEVELTREILADLLKQCETNLNKQNTDIEHYRKQRERLEKMSPEELRSSVIEEAETHTAQLFEDIGQRIDLIIVEKLTRIAAQRLQNQDAGSSELFAYTKAKTLSNTTGSSIPEIKKELMEYIRNKVALIVTLTPAVEDAEYFEGNNDDTELRR